MIKTVWQIHVNLFWKAVMLLIVATFSSIGQGQYTRTLQPDVAHDWEADVAPPPADEWLENMPEGWRAPRGLPSHPVRAFYLVPSNRVAMPGAVGRIRDYLLTLQAFYREQMERNGFGPKTLALETEADGVTPKVYVVNAPNTDSYYRADPWGRVAPAAQAAGLPVWRPGEVWLGVFEAHVMNPDGTLVGEYNGGASLGSGSDAGLGITNSNTLAVGTLDRLTSNVPYNGLTIPELGPYPMVYNITAHSSEGSTLGQFASTRFGVALHELSHGFGLPHDFRNDINRFGNLMGNGFRGFHSWVHPDLYGLNTETRLGYSNALALNVSRYFNGQRGYTDNAKPTLSASASTSGTVANGLLQIPFSAGDASGLAVAWLQLDGNLVGEMELSGTAVSTVFQTPFYETSSANSYIISVFDTQGNKQTQTISVTVPPGTNRAPRAHFSVNPSMVRVGEQVTLNLMFTADPDHFIGSLMVEWDYDGDGTFDTAPALYKQKSYTSYATPGTRLVRVRLTDPAGAVSTSTPIGIRVVGDESGVEGWGLY